MISSASLRQVVVVSQSSTRLRVTTADRPRPVRVNGNSPLSSSGLSLFLVRLRASVTCRRRTVKPIDVIDQHPASRESGRQGAHRLFANLDVPGRHSGAVALVVGRNDTMLNQ